MKLVPTRRTDYGIRALIHLAGADGGPVKAGDIASAMDIPMGFLQQVLQELQRSGLVTSRSGPNGGYSLSRAPETVTIRELVEALEGPLDSGACALRGGPCRWDDVCALHWVWSAARAALCEQLEAATLAQVARDDRSLAEGRATVPADSHRRGTATSAPSSAKRTQSRAKAGGTATAKPADAPRMKTSAKPANRTARRAKP